MARLGLYRTLRRQIGTSGRGFLGYLELMHTMASLHLCIALCLPMMSCFNPDLTKRTIRCDAENPCPDGLSCVNSLCMAPSAAVDASSADLGAPDLTPMGQSGCADGKGTYLGAAWACPGVFGGTNPSPSQRCAIGWIPCSTATGIDLPSCKGLPGFFVSSFVGRNNNGSIVSCMAPNGSNRGIFGCGSGGAPEQPCMGFDQALVCVTSPDWTCSDQFEQTRSNNSKNGVLCCK